MQIQAIPVNSLRPTDSPSSSKKACVLCRHAKAKCIPVTSSLSKPSCERCTKLAATCEYNAGKKRGRRPKVPPGVQSIPPRLVLDSPSPLSQNPTSTSQLYPTGSVSLTQLSRTRLNVNIAQVNASQLDAETSGPGEGSSTDVANSYHVFSEGSAFGVTGGVTYSPGSSLGESRPFEDPVTLGYLNELEAELLVQQFHQHLNPVVCLLDPHLHTFIFLRNHSSLLFSSVLTVTSKMFRPDLYPNMCLHMQTAVGRILTEGTCNIGAIQSLLLLVNWKQPKDSSAWLKIGICIRMAHQLGLHLGRANKVLPDEQTARLVFNAERTWYNLSLFEKAHSCTFDLPNYIPDSQLQDCEVWAREHREWHVDGDLQLACSLAHYIAPQLARITPGLPVVQQIFELDRLDHYMERHLQQWFSDDPPSGLPAMSMIVLKGWALEVTFRVKLKRLELFPSDTSRSNAVFAAVNFVEQMRSIAANGYLQFLQDNAAMTLSRTGLFFDRVFSNVPPLLKSIIVRSMTTVHTFCVESANGDPNAGSSFTARFYARLLRNLKEESRAPSPGPVPPDSMSFAQPDTSTDFLLDIVREHLEAWEYDTFLRDIGMTDLDQVPIVDQEYWNDLFMT